MHFADFFLWLYLGNDLSIHITLRFSHYLYIYNIPTCIPSTIIDIHIKVIMIILTCDGLMTYNITDLSNGRQH